MRSLPGSFLLMSLFKFSFAYFCCLWVSFLHGEDKEYRWRLTSLFQRDRVEEVRQAIESMNPEVKVLDIDYSTSIATLKFDAKKLYPGARTEKNLVYQFGQSLRTHTRGVVESLAIPDTPTDKIKEVTIPIAGLDCKGCSYGAYLSVYKLPGVDYATASFHKGELYARIDTRTDTSEQTLREALLKKKITLNYNLDHPDLIEPKDFKVVRVSSDEPRHDQEVSRAFDRDSQTIWHTKYAINELPERPHELVVDLGKTRKIKGFQYLARQLGAVGLFAGTAFYLSNDANSFDGPPVAKTTFEDIKVPQTVLCPKPVSGRYLLIQVHSTIDDHPHTSAAEIGVLEMK